MDIQEVKRRLPLRELAASLGFAVPERDGVAVKCWWPERHANGDRKEGFNIYEGGTKYKCFACGAQGDVIDLLAEALGLSDADAISEARRRVEGIEPQPVRTEKVRPKREEPRALPELREGTVEELESLGRLRGLSVHGLALAQGMGVLRFGQWCGGRDCWFVTDDHCLGAEARRMDGQLFPAFKDLPARKGHFVKFIQERTVKTWPFGLFPKHSNPALFRRLLLVEGGPDLLAGFHFAERFGALTWLPVAMLGRSCRIEAEALKLFTGRHVRIVPHLDADGGGIEAAKGWAEELRGAGATVDFFKLPEGLRRRDGKPAKDLCDAANLHGRDAGRITDLFTI
jgi:hypothetical protein